MKPKMDKESKKALVWLINRLKRKYRIHPATTEEVLGAISDLIWDWERSKYDLYGLEIQDMLEKLGHSRAPRNKE